MFIVLVENYPPLNLDDGTLNDYLALEDKVKNWNNKKATERFFY